jgi:hypothetical protein
MLALSAPGVIKRAASEPGARPGSVPYKRVTGKTSRRSRLRAAYSPGDLSGPAGFTSSGKGPRFRAAARIWRRLDSRAEWRCGHCYVIALAKKPRFCSHPNHYRVGQRNIFSTADVMNAGGTNGSFFRSPSTRPNSFPQVRQAEKAFAASFMNGLVRTMCGCVPPRYEQASGRGPRVAGFAPTI